MVAAALTVLTLMSGPPLQAQATGSPAQQPGWLANQKSLIDPGDLPAYLDRALQQSGSRMMSADKAQITLMGTITDTRGARSAQFTIQAPGYLVYREGQGHALAFDGSALKADTGPLNANDDGIVESLLAHFPDTVCLQIATGGSYRRIGSHFRADGSKGGNYTGPYWTLLAFSPKTRPGLALGKALQQDLFIAIDESTGLISEIRATANPGSKQQQVVQTQFLNWTQQGSQWYPARITRIENGKQAFTFQVQATSVSSAGPVGAFKP